MDYVESASEMGGKDGSIAKPFCLQPLAVV